MIDYDQLNLIADAVYANACKKGFHDVEEHELEIQIMARHTANLHGEVSELWEAARKGELYNPCDKDANLTCMEEELADIIIRAMDTACVFGLDIGNAVKLKHEYNKTRPHKHGGKLA
jgi:NTP pyrophosphatase (non-canonical NTP hydrolase)